MNAPHLVPSKGTAAAVTAMSGSDSAAESWYDRFCAWAYGTARASLLPGLRNSQYLYAQALSEALRPGMRWLDVGCGHDFLPSWMSPADRALPLSGTVPVGIDVDAAAIRRHGGLRWRLLGNAEMLPFADGAFDLVTANMVVEHVRHPAALFAELSRVLAPGGRLIIHTPSASGYTTVLARIMPERMLAPLARVLLRRKPEDVYPTFYRLNSEAAIINAAAQTGVACVRVRHIHSSPQFVRVPPMMLMEMLLMRLLERSSLKAYRACILAEFRKAS